MAATTTTNHKNHKNGFNLTRAEVDRLESALKDETFVKLLADYARELADPAKKAVYEAEIAQLEAERGYDVSFIHPKPGYVIKVIIILKLINYQIFLPIYITSGFAPSL